MYKRVCVDDENGRKIGEGRGGGREGGRETGWGASKNGVEIGGVR